MICMKRKLIALAVVGAFVAPAAMADTANVNVYGAVNMAFAATNSGTSAAGVAGTSTTQVSSQTSKLGFKGSEDLGGGTSAIWQLESGITPDTTGGVTASGRNSFVGLSGESWGAVLLGQNDSPYKSSTRGMDLFGDDIADNRALMGAGVIAFDNRNANVVQYNSPNLSGFKASAQYAAGAETATASGQSKGDLWSLAATYADGPMNFAAAYEAHNFGTAGTGTLGATGIAAKDKKETAYKVAGGYKMDAGAVNLIYEKTNDDFGAGGVAANDHRAWYLAGKFNVSASDAVKLAYTNRGNIGSAANTGARQISVGYDHGMSKRTTVYALYTKLNNDSAAANKISTAGSTAGGFALPGAGASPSVWALGMKHIF